MDTLCILNVFVFCVCFSHSFFFPFLSLILCVSFCLAQQSSLLDCISQSCISACCNLVPWSKKVPCPRVGPSSCHICSLMLLVAFSIYAVLFCSSLVTCFCFLLKKKIILKNQLLNRRMPYQVCFLYLSSLLLLVYSQISSVYLVH